MINEEEIRKLVARKVLRTLVPSERHLQAERRRDFICQMFHDKIVPGNFFTKPRQRGVYEHIAAMLGWDISWSTVRSIHYQHCRQRR
jgi:hypothetical protein